jgi:hypothetical protein
MFWSVWSFAAPTRQVISIFVQEWLEFPLSRP